MGVEYYDGDGRISELVFFDFDVLGDEFGVERWFVEQGGPPEVLEEVEARLAGSRSLFCMWRIRGNIGSRALSSDTLRSTFLSAVAGSGGELLVCCVSLVSADMGSWFSSLWCRDLGGRSLRGAVCFKKAGQRLEVEVAGQRVYDHVEVSAPGGGGDVTYSHPLLVSCGPAFRRSVKLDGQWVSLAPEPVEEETVAPAGRP